MSRHQIDYESLAQDAMRGLVRAVLIRVAKSGLPGEHHFYISFNTRAPGVLLSKRLLEKYPSEMTIVLQNQFYDLQVTDDRFDVTLSFDRIPERLSIPLKAIRVFFDPSVPFGHQFEETEAPEPAPLDKPVALEDTAKPSAEAEPAPPKPAVRPRLPSATPATGRPTKRATPTPAQPSADKPAPARPEREAPAAPKPAPAKPPAAAPVTAAPTPQEETPPPAEPAKVVKLDAFRKK